jgi:hypothetical protein
MSFLNAVAKGIFFLNNLRLNICLYQAKAYLRELCRMAQANDMMKKDS